MTGTVVQSIETCPEVFCKKDFVRNFEKFSGKQLNESKKWISRIILLLFLYEFRFFPKIISITLNYYK